MARAKRPTPEEHLAILERRKNVARRYLQGQTQWEIARSFEVTQSTINNDLKALREEWRASAAVDTAEFKAAQLAKLDEIERNAWLAWTKSQESAETLKTNARGEEKITKGQAGDPRFLTIALDCVEKRCKILGIWEKVKGDTQQFGDTPEEQISERECAVTLGVFLSRFGFIVTPPAGSGVSVQQGLSYTPGPDSPGPGIDLPQGEDDSGPVADGFTPLDL